MSDLPESRDRFCLDTSALINPWTKRYPIDVFPSYWEKLDAWGEAGIVIAPEEVLRELEKIDDPLFRWAKARSHMFQPVDIELQEALLRIMAQFPRMVDTKKGRNIADPWVVAQAQVSSAIVVTEELPARGKSPKIPDVCEALGVRHTNPIELIRAMKLSF